MDNNKAMSSALKKGNGLFFAIEDHRKNVTHTRPIKEGGKVVDV